MNYFISLLYSIGNRLQTYYFVGKAATEYCYDTDALPSKIQNVGPTIKACKRLKALIEYYKSNANRSWVIYYNADVMLLLLIIVQCRLSDFIECVDACLSMQCHAIADNNFKIH